MNILYFDCQAGISGDMTVGALLDLGVPLDFVCSELDKLALSPGSYGLSASRSERMGMPALKFDVAVHDFNNHRHYVEIDALISGSGLADPVKEKSRLIFRRLAEAEARVHGVAIEQVHFHEVGAIDSIIDIVSAAICLEYLRVTAIYASALPMGSGFVNTDHGRLPVPAPATADLLQGLPLHGECGPGERVTPTGAAILVALASGFGRQPAMLLERIGSGAGGRDFPDCPNILRAFLGHAAPPREQKDDVMNGVIVGESNIDDSAPELLGYAMERLFEEGALDVYFTPIQMKKNRPGVMVSFMCHEQLFERLAQVLLAETTAIGFRYYRADRIVLERRIVEQPTEFGTIRFKQVYGDSGEMLRTSPEYEDCRRIARENNIPCREVMERLLRTGSSGTGNEDATTGHAENAPAATRGHVEEPRFSPDGAAIDEAVAGLLREGTLTLSVAESCSGGLIAKRITDIPGSSRYFCEGVVTYSDAAKMRLLGVPAEVLATSGAVSPECAAAMARGVRHVSGSDLGLAVTGIAGPDGGTGMKPVGTVFISLATPEWCWTKRFQFDGNRDGVRSLTAWTALDWLRRYLLRRRRGDMDFDSWL